MTKSQVEVITSVEVPRPQPWCRSSCRSGPMYSRPSAFMPTTPPCLDPNSGWARSVRRAPSLRHDTLEAELAGASEHSGAVFVGVFIEHDRGRLPRQQPRQLALRSLILGRYGSVITHRIQKTPSLQPGRVRPPV